ncbi:MAG TPA: SAM-dependent methyltransferase [Streptomyces sp.]|jgi:SAM-dependent methyltransferase|nr:SAM-dependent methyltransferase [Streptomyces sp.]
MQVDHQVPELHQDRPHSARMYDYYLGGKTNYRADRAAAGQVVAAWPGVMVCARVNRAFMRRAGRWLAAEQGIRQFLDIGTGIPTAPNLHQVVQSVHPEARVVYADNDPIVLTHAQALMAGTPEGRTAYIEADATDPGAILSAPELAETLDMSKPVAVSLVALLHFVSDKHRPYDVIEQLVAALAPGSALVLTHVTPDFDPEGIGKVEQIYRAGGTDAQARSKEEFTRFFDGLEMVEPGIEVPHRWRPDDGGAPHIGAGDVDDAEASMWAGVALKR